MEGSRRKMAVMIECVLGNHAKLVVGIYMHLLDRFEQRSSRSIQYVQLSPGVKQDNVLNAGHFGVRHLKCCLNGD
jgi:hypothetical protein